MIYIALDCFHCSSFPYEWSIQEDENSHNAVASETSSFTKFQEQCALN